jgi:hypothetical protein
MVVTYFPRCLGESNDPNVPRGDSIDSNDSSLTDSLSLPSDAPPLVRSKSFNPNPQNAPG